METPAILLRKSPWSETSFILTWLTAAFGTIRTGARGATRPGSPFAGKLDFLFHTEIAVTPSRRGDLHSLREVTVVAPFDAGKAGSAGFYLAAYFAEISGLVAPAMQPAPEIFDLLARALAYLQKTPASSKALHHFERELCRILGVHDHLGDVDAPQALASLCGQVPASRRAALKFLSQ